MPSALQITVLMLSLPTASLPGNCAEVTRAIALVGAKVVPMNRMIILRDQTVVMRNGRIEALASARDTVVPPNALRIDARGLYVIPGLADSHVHLQEAKHENRAMLNLFLANGVTTILNLYGSPTHLRLREEVRRGSIQGPRIFTSGRPIGDPVGTSPATSAEEIEQSVIAQKRAGYDFIKLHGDLSRDAYHRLVELTHRENIPLIGHAPRNLGIAPMLQEQQHAVAHVEEYLYAYFHYHRNPDEPIPELDQKIQQLAIETAKARTWVMSTLAVYRGITDQISDLDRVLARPEVGYMPRTIGDAWGWWPPNNTYVRRFPKKTVPWFETQYHLLERVSKAFQDAGVPLLAGTDTPTSAVVPGFSMSDELRALVSAGLTPYEALRAATVNAAEFLGRSKESGTIEVGKQADLVLLEQNPLEDISALSAIRGVITNGKWISKGDLTALLQDAAATRGLMKEQLPRNSERISVRK
jgi:hypothetical protein